MLKVPTIGLSIVNFDNNQHGPNENVKIKNIWDGIETMAAILTMPYSVFQIGRAHGVAQAFRPAGRAPEAALKGCATAIRKTL